MLKYKPAFIIISTCNNNVNREKNKHITNSTDLTNYDYIYWNHIETHIHTTRKEQIFFQSTKFKETEAEEEEEE